MELLIVLTLYLAAMVLAIGMCLGVIEVWIRVGAWWHRRQLRRWLGRLTRQASARHYS